MYINATADHITLPLHLYDFCNTILKIRPKLYVAPPPYSLAKNSGCAADPQHPS